VAGAAVPLVEALGVDAVEAFHPAGEERAGRLDHEVVVSAHQAERVRAPVAAVDHAREEAEERAAVVVVPVGVCPGDGTRADVVNPVGEVTA